MTQLAERGLPSSFPTGWFQVAWAEELQSGEVLPLRYFARDLVLWRTASGAFAIFDAHCPRSGAHLGYGGTVVDDALVCPMHGCRWGLDGDLVRGGDERDSGGAQEITAWPHRVVNGMVLVWYDSAGGAPTWEAPELPEYREPRFYPMYPHAAGSIKVRYQPQMPLENMVDLAHNKYVHRWDKIPESDWYKSDSANFSNSYHGEIQTPQGPAAVTIANTAWGIGLLYSWFSGLHNSTQIVATTPIDGEHSQYRHSIWVERQPGDDGDRPRGLAKAVVAAQFAEGQSDTSGDKPIWENMHYVERPPVVKEEAQMFGALKRWSRKFYPSD
jgi:3-ketosteroid 9alpha-monooxygenase subunit A